MRQLLTSSLIAILILGCKNPDAETESPPIGKGKCFVFEYQDTKAVYQWCQYQNYWYECYGHIDPVICRRKQALTPEDKLAAEDPIINAKK